MIELGIKTTSVPDLRIKLPEEATFWKGVAVMGQKEIRKRTETYGRDIYGQAFKPYSPPYRKTRRKKGRGITPNLSFTSRMLSSMRTYARKNKALIILSGEEGFKAWANEQAGREFFGVSEALARSIFRRVVNHITKKNGLR